MIRVPIVAVKIMMMIMIVGVLQIAAIIEVKIR